MLRAQATTFIPLCTNAFVTQYPIPAEPPVTKATRPRQRSIAIQSQFSGGLDSGKADTDLLQVLQVMKVRYCNMTMSLFFTTIAPTRLSDLLALKGADLLYDRYTTTALWPLALKGADSLYDHHTRTAVWPLNT